MRRPGAVAAVVLGLLVFFVAACATDAGQPATEVVSDTEIHIDTDIGGLALEYVIPVGAGEELDAGTPLEILPAELRVNVGDTIRIENLDDRGHTVGPFFVGANETLTQRFSTPGEFEGVCTVHPSGQLVLIVDA